MGRPAKDYTGLKEGKWTVIRRLNNKEKQNIKDTSWIVRCECGFEKEASPKQIKKYLSKIKCKNCGYKDLSGITFDYLTVIKKVGIDPKNYNSLWECQCKCGNIVVVSNSKLYNKNRFISCGCYGKEKIKNEHENLIGKKFNMLTIIEEVERPKGLKGGYSYFLCECDCGNRKIVSLHRLIEENGTKSCGCLLHLKGKDNPQWKGYNPIRQYLRVILTDWKKKSLELCNYKCFISGEKEIEIHHLYPFHKILEEIINILNLELHEDINNYSQEQLLKMIDLCMKLHKKYGLGICLSKNLHDKFHNIYGLKDFTEENFCEFYFNEIGKEFDLNILKDGD